MQIEKERLLNSSHPLVYSAVTMFECGDGWFDLLDTASFLVNAHLEADPTIKFKVHQVKEKFGTLFYYYSGGDQYIRGVIDFAISMSSTICEISGDVGSLHATKTGWYRTVSPAVALDQDMIKCAPSSI